MTFVVLGCRAALLGSVGITLAWFGQIAAFYLIKHDHNKYLFNKNGRDRPSGELTTALRAHPTDLTRLRRDRISKIKLPAVASGYG